MSDGVDLGSVKAVQQQTWADGDFSMVANLIMNVAEELAEALDIVPDERVVDVACGSGNGAIAAARRAWGGVIGCDYVPALLERGRERAAAERLDVEFVQGDAEDLPFGDAEFDVVMSIFGAMFAPNQEQAAAELLRVCKPGGRIGMANWAPDSGVGQMFMTVAKHAPPPSGVKPPLVWGTEEGLRELFGDAIADLQIRRRPAREAFRSADHFVDFFRTYFGPIKVAFERVGAEGEEALAADLRDYIEADRTADRRAVVLEPEYLQVIATRA